MRLRTLFSFGAVAALLIVLGGCHQLDWSRRGGSRHGGGRGDWHGSYDRGHDRGHDRGGWR